MVRIAPSLAALAAFALIAPASAQERLISQSISGTHRVCSYGIPGVQEEHSARAAASRELRVGLGEPCPQRRPAPAVVATSDVPAMATLRSVERSATRTVCRYLYIGRQYSRSVPAGRACPYVAGPPAVESR
jgi:hypothetical protein